MISRRAPLVSLLLCAVSFGPRVASADPSPAELSAARQAFESAVNLESEERWSDAELKLRQAVAVKDTPGLRFHLARCESELGHLVEAALEYRRASELIERGAKAPDVQKLIGPAGEALKQRIPRVTLVLPADLISPVVALDDKAYANRVLSLGLPVNPGRHTLRISSAGRRDFERTVLLAEGEQLTVRPELAVSAPSPETSGVAFASHGGFASPGKGALPNPSAGRSSSTKLYLMLGESALAVAGLAVGLGYSLAASSAADRIGVAQGRIDAAAPGNTSACSEQTPELLGACTDVRNALGDHERAARLSNIGFIAAGLGVAALATTWFVYPSKAQKTAVLVRPIASIGRVGIEGHF